MAYDRRRPTLVDIFLWAPLEPRLVGALGTMALIGPLSIPGLARQNPATATEHVLSAST